MKIAALILGLASLVGASACAPEVGSEAWCEEIRETPKGDWSANDAAAFAKHCVFQGTNATP